MQSSQQALELVRQQVPGIMLGTMFLFVGLVALAIAAVRFRKGIRILATFGAFSALYGFRLLVESPAFMELLPRPVASAQPVLMAVLTYTILIPALMIWLDLGKGQVRTLVKWLVRAAVVIAVLAIPTAIFAREPLLFMPANNALAIVLTLFIVLVSVVPALSRRYMVIQSRVLAFGSLVLGVAALEVNLATFLPFRRLGGIEPLAFGVFVLCVGYVAVEYVLESQRRLLNIEQELEVAREIQKSILPSKTPALPGLRVAAAYYPMTSVAGDFYEFLPIDQHRAGFLVADVSGHGVPAALIASMLKVATQAAQHFAHEPDKFLKELNRILTRQLNGQFVTASYLFVDLENKLVRYAGAGHPPLLHWNHTSGGLQRIESNGLLFGVVPETEYPCHEVRLKPGDSFLLYTDGLTEPENERGEAFGDARISNVLGKTHASPDELLSALYRESSQWQHPKTSQQDDVTLIALAVE